MVGRGFVEGVRFLVLCPPPPPGGHRIGTAGPFRFLFGHEKEGVPGRLPSAKKEGLSRKHPLADKTTTQRLPAISPFHKIYTCNPRQICYNNRLSNHRAIFYDLAKKGSIYAKFL